MIVWSVGLVIKLGGTIKYVDEYNWVTCWREGIFKSSLSSSAAVIKAYYDILKYLTVYIYWNEACTYIARQDKR